MAFSQLKSKDLNKHEPGVFQTQNVFLFYFLPFTILTPSLFLDIHQMHSVSHNT